MLGVEGAERCGPRVISTGDSTLFVLHVRMLANACMSPHKFFGVRLF